MRATPARLAVTLAALVSACSRQPEGSTPEARLAMLQQSFDALHKRLEESAARDPLVASALADKGNMVVAIRSQFIEELAGHVARRYLNNVTVDLQDVTAGSSGEIRKKTFLGRIKVGAWNVSVELGDLQGDLRAGTPTVSLRAPNMVDIDIPVNVQETTGEARLRFGWDSSGIANVVCKDFELTQGIRGRVLPQTHVISGAMRLHNSGVALTATPLFPDEKVLLRLDLTPESWTMVEAALRSQDTAGTCGALMNPEQALEFLKALAAKGVGVKLPRSIFRTVRLPASLRQEVTVNRRQVDLTVQGESLRIQAGTLWSSASIQIQKSAGATPVKP